MKTLTMLVGLPRAGKSTWAKKTGKPIVSKDAIRLSLHGEQFKEAAEPLVHEIAVLMVKSLFEAGHDDVLLDETNMNRETRERWKSDKWTRAYMYFDTPPEECKRRALQCEVDGIYPPGHAAVLSKVIDRKLAVYEPIEKDEWS